MIVLPLALGEVIGKRTVTAVNRVPKRGLIYEITCACGHKSKKSSSEIRRDGLSDVCKVCVTRTRSTTHGHATGGTITPEYSVWSGMIARCTRPAAINWHNYGGRGITVCDRWLCFEHFLADMGKRPTKKHTLERKENDGNYTPDNCIWATRKTNANNRRCSRFVTANGRTQTVAQWAEELNRGPDTLYRRLDAGWSDEDTINIPVDLGNRYRDHVAPTCRCGRTAVSNGRCVRCERYHRDTGRERPATDADLRKKG